ncbi:hypothetical protein GCM10022261_12760 [Brevibacterium daeguense]|uniref:Uncharacterized protein n=1 Tax=Brevibacterium daeguense TaxID=909936 RepID=A0ABP8EIF6_9MICO
MPPFGLIAGRIQGLPSLGLIAGRRQGVPPFGLIAGRRQRPRARLDARDPVQQQAVPRGSPS